VKWYSGEVRLPNVVLAKQHMSPRRIGYADFPKAALKFFDKKTSFLRSMEIFKVVCGDTYHGVRTTRLVFAK
jgi:hypothetical protein